jgi:hypothetical protein
MKSVPSIIVASSVASSSLNSVPLTNLSPDSSSQASDDVTDLNYSQGSGNHGRGGRNGRGGCHSTLDVIRMAMMHQPAMLPLVQERLCSKFQHNP